MEAPHRHPADVATAVAFINTRDVSDDTIPTPDLALDWLTSHGLVHADADATVRRLAARDPDVGAARLAQVHGARGAMRELADAVAVGRAPDESTVARLNEVLGGAGALQVVATNGRLDLGHAHGADPVGDALARLVEPLVREVATGRPDRLRICGNDTCRWVFYDTSRPNTRRWCEMASCGNRMKVRRFRARARGAGSVSSGS